MKNLAQVLIENYGSKKYTGWRIESECDENGNEKSLEEQYNALEWDVKGIKKPSFESLKRLALKKDIFKNLFKKKQV